VAHDPTPRPSAFAATLISKSGCSLSKATVPTRSASTRGQQTAPNAVQAYVNIHWRFYYYVEGDGYVIYKLQKHPKSTQRGR
jgi:hypothetical protein